MTVLHAIVRPAAHLATIRIAQFAHRGGIGFKPVSDDGLGSTMALQGLLDEGQSRRFVGFFRDVALEDFAFAIDGSL